MLDTRYKDPEYTPEERTEFLLAQMTLEEKVAQLVGNGVMAGELPNIAEQLPLGAGHINGTFLLGEGSAEEKARTVETIQRHMVENTRLGIPAIFHMESASGSFYTDAVVVPMCIAMGASFDPDTVKEMAGFVGRQNRAEGFHHAFGPVLDLCRDVRWGRTGETYGEDPTHAAAMGVAYVTGLQGDDLSHGVSATAKHFLAYGTSDGGQNLGNQRATLRELRQDHAKPWAAAIDAGLTTVMNSYGLIDGEPVSTSKAILTDLLRDELGFGGLLVADYCAIDRCVENWNTTETYGEAGVQSMNAGMDVELPDQKCFGDEFISRIRAGEVSMDRIDEAVRRVLLLKFRLGLFEQPYPDFERIAQLKNRPEYLDTARRLTAESIVMTKNDGVLPLSSGQKVAVIGPNGNDLRSMFGGYMYTAMLEMKSMLSKMFTGMEGTGGAVEAARIKELVSFDNIEDEIRWRYPGCQSVFDAVKEICPQAEYARGCDITGDDRSGFSEAVELAKRSDIVVLVLGGRGGWIAGCTSGEGVEYPHIGLHGVQRELAQAVAETGKPIVVLHMDVRPMADAPVTELASAILETWHPGRMGGQAIGDILSGRVSPSGRLSVTCPRGEYQLPLFFGHKRGTQYSRTMRPGEVDQFEPLFYFGHGLSYTRFEYSDLRLSSSQISPDGRLDISLKVRNSGEMAGDEVVQLYFTDRVSSLARPAKELAGFRRVHLEAGEEKALTFCFDASQTAFIGLDGRWAVEPGKFDILIGASSEDIRLRDELEITGDKLYISPHRVYYSASHIN